MNRSARQLPQAVWQSFDEVGRPYGHDILAAVDALNGGLYYDDATLAVVSLEGTYAVEGTASAAYWSKLNVPPLVYDPSA